ncbi:quinone oxidoreductase [Mycolicibacterium canariasense]|uniref:Quinone oxidoreductase n=1 Tax=Mycolicibacterium canariasense TaxID=228230 RepID=A0A100WKC8_MYCCR|nr:NADPH:quinone oxidoreductase family protein [Mycolicibacterium canariasense]MCV7207678.1 NADPH:quinone oxidoreductase family protein [Mycolicibacterium canariasense]ORV08890.1 alcohol dehydrogenase [Mycolicibacterium canariasense]GAS99791.1 quinone oxidoreductase [Mycolicibacterium canariasense]
MKALVAQALTGTDGLAYTDVDDPVPGDAVIVDVGAAGVCFPDLLLLRGEYQLRLEPPFIPGMEVAGTVRSAPSSSGFVAGQRVSAFTMLGGYAERVTVAPAGVVPTPDGVDDISAAALLGNYYTMYFALQRRAALRAGETVLVLGSAGGIGVAGIQIAKALGARVVALVHRPEALDFVSGIGADVVLPLTEGWKQAVLDATEGRGVDVVVDPVGGDAFDDAIRVLAPEGRLLVIGFAAGQGIPTVKVNRLLLRNVSVVGVGWGEFLRRSPGAQAEVGAGLAELVAAGLRPPAPVTYPLADGAVALQELADGKVKGKLVLVP